MNDRNQGKIGLPLLVLALTTAAIPAHAQPRPVMQDVDPLDRVVTNRAYKVFIQHCPGLRKLSPFITQIRLGDMSIILADGAVKRSWTTAVSIEIRFLDSAIEHADSLGIALLNDYLFAVGAGNDPGILSMNSAGMRLCLDDYGSDFIPAPEARFLTKWPSDLADEKKHPVGKLDSSVVPLDDKEGH